MVRNQNICTCTINANGCFANHGLSVYQTCICGSLNHSVFAADTVSGNRNMELIGCLTHNVQVRHSRFYHNDVSSLSNVLFCFFESFLSIMVIHLIGLSVAECRSGACCVTKWSVERRSVFYGIRHNRRVGIAVFVQLMAQC